MQDNNNVFDICIMKMMIQTVAEPGFEIRGAHFFGILYCIGFPDATKTHFS